LTFLSNNRILNFMKIKPKESYEQLGTGIKLDKNKVYKATIARNQPSYKEKGLIFVQGILLNKYEYTVVK